MFPISARSSNILYHFNQMQTKGKGMQVRIYDIDENGTETLRTQCELRECFDDAEYHTARRELEIAGRYWAGGGAAPMVLILPVRA